MSVLFNGGLYHCIHERIITFTHVTNIVKGLVYVGLILPKYRKACRRSQKMACPEYVSSTLRLMTSISSSKETNSAYIRNRFGHILSLHKAIANKQVKQMCRRYIQNISYNFFLLKLEVVPLNSNEIVSVLMVEIKLRDMETPYLTK